MNRLWEYILKNTLFSKMYAGILLSMLVSAFGTYLYIAQGQKELLRDSLLSQGRTASHLLADNIKLSVFAGDSSSVRDALAHFLDQKEDVAALVFQADRTLLAQAFNPDKSVEVSGDFTRSPPDRVGIDPENCLVEEREGAFLFWRPITTSPAGEFSDFVTDDTAQGKHRQGPPIGYLALVKSKSALESAAAALVGKTSLILAGFFILATLSTLLLVGITTRPLRRLAESLRQRYRGEDAATEGELSDAAYGKLIKEIEEGFARISDFNEELSKKVSERTADLNRVNQELESRVAERTIELEEKHRELLHAVKLTTAGKMLASIAHEVNSPLCAIKMSLEELKSANGLSPGQNLLDEVLHECDRLAGLVGNLRMSTLPPSAMQTRYDLRELLDSVFMLTGRNFRNAGITLVRDYSPLCESLTGCPDQLFLVFMNLAQNSSDAMEPKGGGILRVTTALTEGIASVAFSDTGEGITPENLERIFEPFFTTKPQIKGTGLGLSISLGIVQSHGGTIEIESSVGQGTTVTVKLPVV